jgi:hypothetical protein
VFARDFGKILAGRDPKLGRQGLDEHRDQVCRDDDPDQRVPKLRSALNIRRKITRVDVGHGGYESRTEKRK